MKSFIKNVVILIVFLAVQLFVESGAKQIMKDEAKRIFEENSLIVPTNPMFVEKLSSGDPEFKKATDQVLALQQKKQKIVFGIQFGVIILFGYILTIVNQNTLNKALNPAAPVRDADTGAH